MDDSMPAIAKTEKQKISKGSHKGKLEFLETTDKNILL